MNKKLKLQTNKGVIKLTLACFMLLTMHDTHLSFACILWL